MILIEIKNKEPSVMKLVHYTKEEFKLEPCAYKQADAFLGTMAFMAKQIYDTALGRD